VTIPPEVTPENVTTSIVDTSCTSCPGLIARLRVRRARVSLTLSANPRSRAHLLSQLSRAHVICLVYSISEPSSFDRVAEYWLPLFRREGINASLSCWEIDSRHWLTTQVPVILVGNKIDLRGGEVTNEGLEDEIAPIMREFKVGWLSLGAFRERTRARAYPLQEVETVVECSALLPLNVSEVFYFAQKAVLHPTAPLYDSREHVSPFTY
jgi:Ras family protein T1